MTGAIQGLIGSFVAVVAPPSGNLITSPGFETLPIDTGWQVGERVNTQANTGSWSFHSVGDESGPTMYGAWTTLLTPGFNYSLSFYIKGASNFTLTQNVTGQSQYYIGGTNYSQDINVTTNWQKVSILNKPATNAVFVFTIISYYGFEFWIDDITVQYGPTA